MSKIKTGIKMRVTPEQSQKVQEICFKNGIGWRNTIGRRTVNTLQYLNEPFLYINEDNSISYGATYQEEYFSKDKNEEVSAELFIRTHGTCIESETPTEDINKVEIMEELKLECLVEGYEGTYFEVGQVWETRDGNRLKVKGFDFNTDAYKLTLSEVEDSEAEFYYTLEGRYHRRARETDLDLVRLITTETTPTEEPQPKTLSEYLKENNAYGIFVENCVESFLKGLNMYKVFKSENNTIRLSNIFSWTASKGGQKYWENLQYNQPENLAYDMNEIIFAEVDRRLAEQTLQPEIISAEEFVQVLPQKPLKRYMVFVEGKSPPRGIYDSYDLAEKESKRLSAKAIGCNVFVVEIVKTFKSKVIVEEF